MITMDALLHWTHPAPFKRYRSMAEGMLGHFHLKKYFNTIYMLQWLITHLDILYICSETFKTV